MSLPVDPAVPVALKALKARLSVGMVLGHIGGPPGAFFHPPPSRFDGWRYSFGSS